MKTHILTRARLLEVLSYDPEAGVFRWKVSRGTRKAGATAGNRRVDGYSYIKIDEVLYRSTRLVWLWMYGRWPREHIDHIDGNTSNDRINNLREASRSQNLGNRKRNKNNSSGFKGVHARGNLFRAYVTKDGKRFHLGVFHSAIEAHNAYMVKAKELFGEFARFI